MSALLGSMRLRGRYDSSTVARWIDERRVDGLVFARCTPSEKILVESARRARIPMVFVAPDENFTAGPVFKTHNRQGAVELARHLVRLGHRRVGFVGGPYASVDTRDRLRGLRDGLTEAGLTMKKDFITYAASYGSEDGVPHAREWLSLAKSRRPTVVACGNDSLALGFMRTVLQAGLRVPEDLSVAGFDGVIEGALYWPGLTTVKQPSHELGMAACKMLLRMIESGQTNPTARIDLPARLILRESTGPAP